MPVSISSPGPAVPRSGSSETAPARSRPALATAAKLKRLSRLTLVRPRSCLAADEMTVAHALTLYGEEHGPTVADPQRIGYAIEALMTFWGDLRVAAIRGETCRTYAHQRGRAPGTIRRELGMLQAALNHCVREDHFLSAPKVTLPEKPRARERWLTQEESYWLLRAARNLRRDGRHLAWFIVAGLYTGRVSSSAMRARRFSDCSPARSGSWATISRWPAKPASARPASSNARPRKISTSSP
uniref:Phage integrase family protein n=1 Tax=Cereibacter sphaeroides (strain ATCC 17025 / ATH 2.4.3) TaxID=349102 RepID=A4WPR9_CERS5